MQKKGTFTISIDTELAWGTFDLGGHIKYKEAYKKYRPIITKVLGLFDKYEIPATWAIVGHLFLEGCKKEGGITHPEIIRPRHKWFRGDWFRLDPATNITADELWYGRDIVKMILSAKTKQEIASHSFCHMIFSDPGCSSEAAESDLAKCVDLAKKEGIELKTFVFPRNSGGHFDLLAKYGFKVFRGQRELFPGLKLSYLQRFLYFVSDLFCISPPVVVPNLIPRQGLIEVKDSMLFRFSYGISRFIPKGARFKRAKKGIDKAIAEGKIFHLWLHPFNFAWQTESLFDELEHILSYAQQFRKDGRLNISTLYDAAQAGPDVNADGDHFNPEGVILHDDRSGLFKKDYSDNLSDYYSNAFKYGRKKVEPLFFDFLSRVNGKKRILDLGSGTGYFLNLVRKNGFEGVGVDISENMIKQLKTNYPELCVNRADARNTPFADNTFDAVVSIETLRYFSDQRPLLKEIFRAVKPGGLVFITAAPAFALNFYGFFNAFCRLLRLKKFVSCFQSFETVGSLQGKLKNAGFVDIKISGRFFGPYFLLDKIFPKISSFLMRKFEPLDDKLSSLDNLKNFSNHLIAVAKKP